MLSAKKKKTMLFEGEITAEKIQVEEEENAQEYIDHLKLIGDNGYGLYQLDKELATRVYNVPAPLATKE